MDNSKHIWYPYRIKNMKKILRFFGFNSGSNREKTMVLDREEEKEFSLIFSKSFNDLEKKDRKRLLELAAKDFSGKFAGVIKDLSRE